MGPRNFYRHSVSCGHIVYFKWIVQYMSLKRGNFCGVSCAKTSSTWLCARLHLPLTLNAFATQVTVTQAFQVLASVCSGAIAVHAFADCALGAESSLTLRVPIVSPHRCHSELVRIVYSLILAARPIRWVRAPSRSFLCLIIASRGLEVEYRYMLTHINHRH